MIPLTRSPYAKFRHRELTLNDELAIDRTILANERTMLAFGRTALAMAVIGGSCLQFFDKWYMDILGGLFLASAVVITWHGWRRHRHVQRLLAPVMRSRMKRYETEQGAGTPP